MIGINADLPVREAPVIMLTASELNDKQRGEYSAFRGHKIMEFIVNFILKPHFQPFRDFEKREFGAPCSEFLSGSQHGFAVTFWGIFANSSA